jgi:NADPH-dependent curcumin reductase
MSLSVKPDLISNANGGDGMIVNQKWVLKARPVGHFHPTKDVELITEKLALSYVTSDNDRYGIPDDHVVVKVDTLSVDAFIRTMLDEEAYHGSIALGNTIPAVGYGTVVYAGRNASQKVGSKVLGMMGAQQYAVVPTETLFTHIKFPFLKPSASLGLMSVTSGLTAYVGCFYVVAPPKRGQTVVVTGATGAVGSTAVQLLKTTGARVIGIAGGPKKTKFLLEDLALDGAVDYKHADKTVDDQLAETCPNGIDFIYDNVGGDTLDMLLGRINPGARIVICGAISQYSGNLNKGKVQGPGNYLKLAERGATMKGFNVMQYLYKLPFAILGMLYYSWRGKVILSEHIEEGVESFPFALEKMFKGGHIGKLLVQVDLN